MAEVAVGTVVIALLLVVAVVTLRVTEKGTINQKQRQQAMDLAKARSEELKSYLSSQSWGNMQVDVRFPATQTPAVNSYGSYAPTTVTLGKNQYVLDPEVRYVMNDASNNLQYIPTPGNALTPEIGDLVRVRMDCFYGPLNQFVPLPTAEAVNNVLNRVVYTNLISNKVIKVGGVGSIWGYIFGGTSGCDPSQPVQGVEVGLFQGVQMVTNVVTDQNGKYEFDNVTQGTYFIQTVSSPGYSPVGSCGFTEPVTLTGGSNLANQNLGVKPLPVWNYYGVVVYTTPVVTTVPATSPTPVLPVLTAVATVANALVFADDGNSSPVTTNGSGAYTITQVRSTPVAGHSYDTIEGDDLAAATPRMGRNYNVGPNMYPQSYSGGQTYLGPITIFVNSLITNTQPATFVILDGDTLGAISSSYYSVTVNVADGSPAPPSTILSSGVTAILNVHQGAPNVTLGLSGNPGTAPGYSPFNGAVTVDASVTAPITLLSYAVGSMAGTVAGMGASFNYAQFKVRAVDDSGQYTYDIPVSYDGASTFGTFNYHYLRTPLESPFNGDINYNFNAEGSGDYTSTQLAQDARQKQLHTLDGPLLVSLLNVYMAVTVTQYGGAYPYGSWISAQMVPSGTTPAALPTPGQGSGFGVSNYFSGVTKGDGTAFVQVQLSAGAPTTYVVTSQIVDPNTYALSSKSTTLTMGVTNTFASPKGVSFGF